MSSICINGRGDVAAAERTLAEAESTEAGILDELPVSRAARITSRDGAIQPLERELWLGQARAGRLSPRQRAVVQSYLGSPNQTVNPVAFANALAPKNSIEKSTTSLGIGVLLAGAGLLVSACGSVRRRMSDAEADDECGMPDSSNALPRWRKDAPEIRFLVDPRLIERFGEQGYDAVVAAATAWQEAVEGLPPIVLERAAGVLPMESEGANVIAVGTVPEEAAKSVAVTVLTYYQHGEMVDADITVNEKKPVALRYTPGASSSYDLQTTLIHEMGHALGLPHLCERIAAMYHRVNLGERREVSRPDDEAGDRLYE